MPCAPLDDNQSERAGRRRGLKKAVQR